jgi:hypothetical protein
MRYMALVKGPEKAGFPPKALMDAIDQLVAEQIAEGQFVSAGGLLDSAHGTRVRIKDNKLVVTDGPYTEAKEVVGGFAIFNYKSKEEAVENAVRFMELHRVHWPGWEGECEIREMMEEPPQSA